MTDHLGPGPIHRSETRSGATPVAASVGVHFGARSFWRPLAGLVTILFVVAIVAVCANLFRGGFTSDVPVTVLSQRAGLVMNPGAKVKLHGVQVGRVVSIEDLPNGQAALHLAMDPSQLHLIPANVLVDITAPTVFGAKFVQLAAPDNPSPQRLRAGQVLDAKHVTVETNTLFEELTSVLSKIEPAKLNETLGALAQSVNGRGQKFGQALSDLDSILARLDPSLPNLSHELAVAPGVIGAYADAAPDLISTADSATRLSGTLVDEQHNLDALLVSVIGLADIGNQVLGENRQPLTDVLHLLVPSTDLTNQYNQALYCGLAGILPLAYQSPLAFPGIVLLAGFTLGMERYRYPTDLPKVAAKGRPLCVDLPRVPFEARAPYVVADVGMNPARYGNQGILLNSDALKQSLFGPIAGPPRNTEQFGMPG